MLNCSVKQNIYYFQIRTKIKKKFKILLRVRENRKILFGNKGKIMEF